MRYLLILTTILIKFLVTNGCEPLNSLDLKRPPIDGKPINEQRVKLDAEPLNKNDPLASNNVKFLLEIGKLKHLERTGWLLHNVPKPERIAGHMYRMAIMPMFILNNNGKYNLDKVMKLSLVHDIAECIVGDYTPYDDIPIERKRKLETKAVEYLKNFLSKESSDYFMELFEEYEERKTPEAKLTKELDHFDLVLQAFEYERSQYESTKKLPNFSEFFDFNRVLSQITLPELKEMVSEILYQRSVFLKSICDTCEQSSNSSTST